MNFIRDQHSQALIGIPPEGHSEIEKLQMDLTILKDKYRDLLDLTIDLVVAVKSGNTTARLGSKYTLIEEKLKGLRK